MRILVAARPETIIKEVGVEMYNKHLGGFNAPTGYYDHSYCETNGIAWAIVFWQWIAKTAGGLLWAYLLTRNTK